MPCPSCHSSRVWKDGLRYTGEGEIQRYLCRDCGRHFSKTINSHTRKVHPSGHLYETNRLQIETCFNGSGLSEHIQGIHTPSLKRLPAIPLDRQICAHKPTGAKNLAKVETRIEKRAAGATTQAEIKGKIVAFMWHMKKQGYAESTVTGRVKLLRILVKRGANLYDPETVKDVIARQQWCPGRKQNAVHAYSSFLKMVGGKWEPPRYRRIEKLPWVPTETEVDQLIAGCSHRVTTFLQLLKETGMRPGEAWILKWIDLDFNDNSVRITPEKGSKPRILKLSNKLVAMLKALPQRNDYVFKNGLLKHFGGGFRLQRIRIAAKLKNPRINRISFKTFRHFKGTMEYHKTKDILHVMQVLGHKNTKNTLVYTHLVNFKADEFISKIAKTAEEASKLVEAGFEFVCTTPENLLLFKKRK